MPGRIGFNTQSTIGRCGELNAWQRSLRAPQGLASVVGGREVNALSLIVFGTDQVVVGDRDEGMRAAYMAELVRQSRACAIMRVV